MELIQLPFFGRSAQPSQTHFKRKFSVTPCGVFDEVTQTGELYLFSQLLGKTNSNHILSILNIAVLKKKAIVGGKARVLRLNFDNCSVQKCYLMIAYACYLVKNDHYDLVEIHFRIAGHTKFSPDRMFAYFSELLKALDLFEVEDIVHAWMAEYVISKGKLPYSVTSLESTTSGKTDHFFDFKDFFKGHFKAFDGISSHHLIQISRKPRESLFRPRSSVTIHPGSKSPFGKTRMNLILSSKSYPLSLSKPPRSKISEIASPSSPQENFPMSPRLQCKDFVSLKPLIPLFKKFL